MSRCQGPNRPSNTSSPYRVRSARSLPAKALIVLEGLDNLEARSQLLRYLEAKRPRTRGPSRRALPSMKPAERSDRVN
jgi:hypothetical protein